MDDRTGNVSLRVLGLSAAVLLGCSSGGSAEGNMSCPLQAETCWNTAVAEAQACVPATTGVLASDNRTCTFDDGTVAVFDHALSFPIPPTVDTSVTITKNGTQCAKLTQADSIANVTLTTQSGAHKVVTSLSGVTLTCGDGTKLATKWSDCEMSGSLDTTGQPAISFSSGSDSGISLDFQGYFTTAAGFSSFGSWFRCEKP